MCTNVIKEVHSNDEKQNCNTIINKKCHKQNCNEHRGKVQYSNGRNKLNSNVAMSREIFHHLQKKKKRCGGRKKKECNTVTNTVNEKQCNTHIPAMVMFVEAKVGLEVAIMLQQLQPVVKFLDKNARIFQESSAQLCQEKTTEMY